MTIQNNVRFGMVIGPFNRPPSLNTRQRIRQSIEPHDPLKAIHYQTRNPQNQQPMILHYLISGEQDNFIYRHGREKTRSVNPFIRRDGRMMLRELLDRAIRLNMLPRR